MGHGGGGTGQSSLEEGGGCFLPGGYKKHGDVPLFKHHKSTPPLRLFTATTATVPSPGWQKTPLRVLFYTRAEEEAS